MTLQGNALLSSLSDSFFPLQSLYYNVGHKNTINPKISILYISLEKFLTDSCRGKKKLPRDSDELKKYITFSLSIFKYSVN